MDSFMRETARFYGLGLGVSFSFEYNISLNVNPLVMMNRRVVKDFTFSDGTVVPTGTHLCANAWGVHRDDAYYPNADEFNGFRFFEESGVDQPLMATPSLDYMAFGHGRPAWYVMPDSIVFSHEAEVGVLIASPGRFFAVAELKMILAHILLRYNFKLETGGIPQVKWLESKVIPDTSVKILFKKREL